jgi:hypothetical protein
MTLQLVTAPTSDGTPVHLLPLPAPEQPAVRLLRTGSASLSDAEILAVLIGGGRSGDRPLALAHHLLADRGGLTAIPPPQPQCFGTAASATPRDRSFSQPQSWPRVWRGSTSPTGTF